MNPKETREKLHKLIDMIKNEETLSFIYKIVLRLLD